MRIQIHFRRRPNMWPEVTEIYFTKDDWDRIKYWSREKKYNHFKLHARLPISVQVLEYYVIAERRKVLIDKNRPINKNWQKSAGKLTALEKHNA